MSDSNDGEIQQPALLEQSGISPPDRSMMDRAMRAGSRADEAFRHIVQPTVEERGDDQLPSDFVEFTTALLKGLAEKPENEAILGVRISPIPLERSYAPKILGIDVATKPGESEITVTLPDGRVLAGEEAEAYVRPRSCASAWRRSR